MLICCSWRFFTFWDYFILEQSFGPSMIPTLHPSGNVLLAERISTRSQKLSRGDIVVFQSPEDPKKTPTKRVVGIEGDCISFVVDPGKNDQSKTIVVCCYQPLLLWSCFCFCFWIRFECSICYIVERSGDHKLFHFEMLVSTVWILWNWYLAMLMLSLQKRFSFWIIRIDLTVCVFTWEWERCCKWRFWSVDISFGFRFLKDMYGCKVTMFITRETRECLVLYLTVLFKAKCFGGYMSLFSPLLSLSISITLNTGVMI